MNKLKSIVTIIVLMLLFISPFNYAMAVEGIKAEIKCNKQEIRKGDEIELILSFNNFDNINKGLNSYKAKIEYDEKVFETLKTSNFESLNSWEEFLYNNKNHEFIAIHKAGVKENGNVVKIKMKVKENINPQTTEIIIKDILTSEGKVDMSINPVSVKLQVIYQQGNNNKKEEINNQNETSNNSNENKANLIANTILPNAGTKTNIILILAEIFAVLSIIFALKIRKINKKISGKAKFFVSFLIIGVISTQCVTTLYAFTIKGELNNDDYVNYKDISILEQHLINLKVLDNQFLNSADVNADGKISISDLSFLVQKIENSLEYTANINSNLENYFVRKNEEIELKFTALVSYDAKIAEITINGKNYKVTNEDNNYKVKLEPEKSSGVKEFKFTKAKLDVGKEVELNFVEKIEVLKTVPNITDYTIENITIDAKTKVSFILNDTDGSVTNTKYVLLEKGENNEFKQVSEGKVELGKNELLFDLKENVLYDFNIILAYNLDTNKLGDKDLDNEGEISITKPISFNLNYNFSFKDLVAIDKEGNQKNSFAKNEEIILEFTSSNDTKFVPEYVVINSKKYEVIKNNSKYQVKLNENNETGNKKIKIEKIILSNGKVFEINENNTIDIVIQKALPIVNKVEFTEDVQKEELSIKVDMEDSENTIIHKTLIVKDTDQKEIARYELNSNHETVAVSVKDELTAFYTVEIIADYNLTNDEKNVQKNELLYTNTFDAKPKVIISNVHISKTIAEKKDDIILTYNIDSNKIVDVDRIVINNIEIKVIKNENGTYSANISAGEVAGKKEFKLTEVIFIDEKNAHTLDIQKIEVLKEKPSATNYHFEDNFENSTVKCTFEINDPDNALISLKAELYKTETGEKIASKEIALSDVKEVEFGVVDKEEYEFKLIANYIRTETDVIPESENNKTEILLEKPIQQIKEYNLELSNLKTYKGNEETAYFGKEDEIKLSFAEKNDTKFIPEKVQVNNKLYDITSYENDTFIITIQGFENAGVKELEIQKIILNNTKELNITENNKIKVEILKERPNISDFSYNNSKDGKLTINFKINDNDSAFKNGEITVLANENNIFNSEITSSEENSFDFNIRTEEEFKVIIKLASDLDSNEIENGKNDVEEIIEKDIYITQELIEFKDITNVQLYTNINNKIEECTEIDINNFKPEDYIAKLTMKSMPNFYAEVKKAEVSNNELNLILKYDNTVTYENSNKINEVKVKFGEISNGIASNLSFEKLREIIINNPTAEINLTSDLDAAHITPNINNSYLGEFKGKINGNGHIIKNLKRPLFTKLSDALIENVIITDANVTNGQAIITNYANNTKFRNVHMLNSKIDVWHNNGTGLFIGKGENNTQIFECSGRNVSVKSNKVVGGFAGYLINNSLISNSYIIGSVNAGYDAAGGIIGQTSGAVTMENCYADIDFNMSADWATGGLVGYIDRNNATLINNISLAIGNIGNRVKGNTTNITNKSKNNYEIEESNLKTDANGEKIITIKKSDINEEFLKNNAKFNEYIWYLKDANSSNMPCLNNLDPANPKNIKENVRPENLSLYIPDITRLKNMPEYTVSKEIAYHNVNLLIPFYDAKFILQYGNMISENSILNTQKIKMILPYDKNGNAIIALNSNNFDSINSIKIIFENDDTEKYNLTFKGMLNDVATYKINELNISYSYNKMVLNTNIDLVKSIVEKAKQLDYKTNIQNVTEEEESRLYVDYYNESVKPDIENIILEILANIDDCNIYLDNSIFKQIVTNKILNNSGLEKILYTYNYFDKWYNFEMGGTSLSNIIFTKVNMINSSMTIDELINLTMSQSIDNRKTSKTVYFFDNVIKRELGNKNIGQFLEYFMQILDGESNGNNWFAKHFKGILREKPALGKPDQIRYRAWDMMKARNHLLLPVLSAPQEDMYLISVPSQLVIGSMNRYSQHLNNNTEGMLHLIDNYATMIGNFYGVSSCFINNSVDILNSKAHIQYDTRFGFPNIGDQSSGSATDPVIKWVYEAIGSFAAANGSGAYANGTDVYWVYYNALGGDFYFKVFTHETAHNQDGYYFYEGYGRRDGTDGEDHADSNIAQDLGNGSVVFNLRSDIPATADDSNNLKLSSISGVNEIHNYYKEMFETYYVLDYLTAQAFMSLTPEEQSKVAVQVEYKNSTDYEEGGASSIYKKIPASEFEKMTLNTMEDLWNNRIALRGEGTVNGNGAYGGDTHQSIYWYQPHNNKGRPDSYSFKRLGFEMLGVAGYSDGYVTYRSRKSKNDLDALKKITGDENITWKKYKLNRYENVKNNLNKIEYFNTDEVIESYKNALKEDAKNGNRDNTNSLRNTLYGIVKRATKDFTTGGIYDAKTVTEISSADELIKHINKEEWGNYILTQDIDFSAISKTNEGVYIDKAFVGRINGNGHKITGLSGTLFTKMVYAELQNIEIFSPNYDTNINAILAKTTKNIILKDVVVTNINIQIPFTAKKEGILEWYGTTEIKVKNNTINSLEDLLKIAGASDALSSKMKYTLETDIDASIINDRTAIFYNKFDGVIDGNGHTISDLSVPIFKNLGGTIKNLNIKNANINKPSGEFIAVLAEKSNGATISNVKLDNIKILGHNNTAGLIAHSTNTTLNNIEMTNIDVTGNNYYAGGLIGRAFNTNINNLFIKGKVTIYATHNGGVIGAMNKGSMQNVVAKVNMNRPEVTDNRNQNAQLIGSIESGSPNIRNCVTIGDCADNVYKVIGGINNYNAGDIYGTRNFVNNVYELTSAKGLTNISDNNIIKPVTDEEIKSINFYKNKLLLDENIWNLNNLVLNEINVIK